MDSTFFDNPALTLSLALAAGVLCQGISHHLRIPGIVMLLGIGVVLGPDLLSVIRPANLGDGLSYLVGFAVAVVLFEGGMNLRWKRLMREQTSIRRLVTWGAIVTAIGGTLAAKWLMPWDWDMAVLFGTLVIVTGPTVITPLLRRIKVNTNVNTILEAEGILIDPIGALIAVVALEVVAHPTANGLTHAAVDLTLRLGLGAVLGVAGGFLIVLLLRPSRLIPDGLENIFTLAMVLALYHVSDSLQPESGIAAAATAGLVVGNMDTRVGEELREFKEQLTVLLIGLLFVLLSADVRFAEVQALGWHGLLVVACLIFLVRPLNILVGTMGLPLSVKEKAFLAWIAPRGIVAAAVASYFAVVLEEAGIPGGSQLRALVFMVIAVTVTVSGLTGGLVAGLLGVRRKNNVGYVLLGAGPLGLVMGRCLREYGEEVTFIDNNPDHIAQAQAEEFRVVFGNGLEERTQLRARADAAAGCLAITPNDELNYLFADRIQRQFKDPKVYVALHYTKGVVTESMRKRVEARLLFGALRHVDLWSVRVGRKLATMEVWTKADKGSAPLYENPDELNEQDRAYLPLVKVRKGRAMPVDETTHLAQGDRLVVLLFEEARKEATESLQGLGLESGMITL